MDSLGLDCGIINLPGHENFQTVRNPDRLKQRPIINKIAINILNVHKTQWLILKDYDMLPPSSYSGE